MRELAIKYKTSKDTVKKILSESGVEIRPRNKRRSILFGKESEVIERYRNGESLESISRSFDCANKTVRRIVENSLDIRTPGFYRQSKCDFVYRNGYRFVLVDDSYPKKRKGSRFYPEHILIIEKEVGRLLNGKKEHVHHVDLDKGNNDRKNLLLCLKKRHAEIHNQLDSIVSELIKEGVIVFNLETKRYERKK